MFWRHAILEIVSVCRLRHGDGSLGKGTLSSGSYSFPLHTYFPGTGGTTSELPSHAPNQICREVVVSVSHC